MSNPTEQSDFARQIQTFQADVEKILEQVRSVIVGHEQVINEVMTCLLSGGHALLEGVPGLGKTLLVRTLAESLDLSFSRIQFTPDLMPADITGTNVVVGDGAGGKTFQFQSGPIFSSLILADEINRATPKTQSAVLEAMQAQTVSVARTTHELPSPFMVLATQNPLEMAGTYPLPEAQLDRFMFKIKVASPSMEELLSIVDRTTGAEEPHAARTADARNIEQMKGLVRQVEIASHVKEYVARVIMATHPRDETAPATTRKYVRYGASPRGAQAMVLGAKVRALQAGRANVAFSDVHAVALAALRHRLILSFEGQADGVSPEAIIEEILESIPQAEVV